MSRSRTPYFFTDIIDNSNRIADIINKNKIFMDKYKLIVKSNIGSHVEINFILINTEDNIVNYNNYCSAIYYMEKSKLLSHITYVNSSISNKIGSFLVNIQVLLARSINVNEITLDNYTDNPTRASQGIYSLFDIETRKSLTMHNKSNFARKSNANKLLMSEGQMRLVFSKSGKDIMDRFSSISSSVNSEKEPWDINIETNINTFKREIKSVIGKLGYGITLKNKNNIKKKNKSKYKKK
jgi:hypothetical protein